MQEIELCYFFLKKAFLYFRKGLFRTLVHPEPKAYSEQCQTSTMESFGKIATKRTFLYFAKQNFFIFPEMKLSKITFQEIKNPLLNSFLYISRNGSF